MKKSLFAVFALLMVFSLLLGACGGAAKPAVQEAATKVAEVKPTVAAVATAVAAAPTAAPAAAGEYKPATDKPKKIAFFVSDLSNVFHQGQATEAQKYAKDKYGAEVFIFDGKSDSAVMTQNVDQVVAQGMDGATLHIWDYEAATPGVMDALSKGIVMTSFFSPLGDTGIPTARSDEAGISFEMGAEMARQWQAAFPDKPIVMAQLGWPNHTEVKSGRTDPFVKGVLSVDPKATDLGCLDASKGPDTAKQIILDLVTQHPEVNLIYSEASNLTVGTMAALQQAGRGKFDNGKPLTEIVASVDFDEVEYKQVFDPNSSLKMSMGLPPLETGRGRIDLIMDVAAGKIPMTAQPAQEEFYKAYNVSPWTMSEAEAVEWLNTQFGTNIAAPAAAAPVAIGEYTPATDKPKKIAFFVSDLSNVFHQGQATEAQKYAKDKYGAEVFIFDGKSDSAVMTQNVDQVVAQGMDGATLHIWDYEAATPGVMDALEKGIVMTSFFSPLGDTGIPTARSDEAGISFEMGAEMARQWQAAFPDKPIVMAQLGWPNHTEVKSGRTDPFVKGVLSVDPKATDLGCLDASKGPDTAKQIILDLVTQHPEVNLIYSEASNLTVGTMAALQQAGRGKFDNGKPLTEIVASVDFDEVEYKQVFDPNSSLKMSMGLPPLETGRGRIDLIMDVAAGKIPMATDPAQEEFYKAYNVSPWTMSEAEAVEWLNTQFGTKLPAP
jgi:ABC-type sugar transport system substrate-binding protein